MSRNACRMVELEETSGFFYATTQFDQEENQEPREGEDFPKVTQLLKKQREPVSVSLH